MVVLDYFLREGDIKANFQEFFFHTGDNSRVLQYFVHEIPVYYGLPKLPDARGCTDKERGAIKNQVFSYTGHCEEIPLMSDWQHCLCNI